MHPFCVCYLSTILLQFYPITMFFFGWACAQNCPAATVSWPILACACPCVGWFFFVLCVCVQFAGIDFSVLPAFFLLSQSQSALVALSADDVPPRFAAAPPPGVTPRAQPDRRASSLSRHHAPAATAAARSPTLGFVAASACGLREAVRGPRVLSQNAKANK